MNKYEIVLMFYPKDKKKKRVQTFDRLKKIIEDEGTLTNVDEWGMRKLAYEIEYTKEAFYYLLEVEAQPETVDEFSRIAKILDSVMRHMVVRVDK